ncbi:MAG: carbon starvation protein A [Candidatus Odinarchaeota archaeon]
MPYPAIFVGIGLVIFIVGYWLYARFVDRSVWAPDSSVKTPAHMYMDGVEFFPTSKSVLFGFQFKSIAALGPISGPFIALVFGWVPAFLWIIFGTFFIGWIHDYTAVMITVRSEGESFGPVCYRLVGSRARKGLMGFIIFYLILVMAVFAYICGAFFKAFPQSIIPTILTIVGGFIAGILMYRLKINIIIATVVGIIFMVIGVAAGLWLNMVGLLAWVAATPREWWIGLALVLVFFGATLAITDWAQPVNYIAFWPCFAAIILLIVGALLSPLLTMLYPLDPVLIQGLPFYPPTATNPLLPFYTDANGPIWPILFVAIACGAVSGWHSLVGSSATGKQLNLETDALPVAGGSMFLEGVLAMAAMSAYVVIAPAAVVPSWFLNFPTGAAIITQGMFGGSAISGPILIAFFAMVLELYAITVLQLMPRFFRMAAADLSGTSVIAPLFKNKWIGALIGILIAFAFAATGAWYHIWLLFGGSNQLLAGLCLMLGSVYLIRNKKPTKYTLIPAFFMIITCQAALLWESWVFLRTWVPGTWNAFTPTGWVASAGSLVADLAAAGVLWPAQLLTGIMAFMAIVLFILGCLVFYDAFKAWRHGPESEVEATAE